MSTRSTLALCVALLAIVGASAGSARAAGECDGLRVCLPVTGPWVAVPSTGGVDYELACPLSGYVIGGTDARIAAKDVDVSFRGEPGSPVGAGVTTRRSAVFHAVRTRSGAGATGFRPFIGCVPTRGGGGRALTGLTRSSGVFKPTQPAFSVVLNSPVTRRSQTLRVACPSPARLIGATHAVAFRQPLPPTAAQLGAVRVRRSVVEGVVVARVTTTAAAGPQAEVQLRAVCARPR